MACFKKGRCGIVICCDPDMGASIAATMADFLHPDEEEGSESVTDREE